MGGVGCSIGEEGAEKVCGGCEGAEVAEGGVVP